MPRNPSPEVENEPEQTNPEPDQSPSSSEPEQSPSSPFFLPTTRPPIPDEHTSETGPAWSENQHENPSSSDAGAGSGSRPRSTRARLTELRKMTAAAVRTAGGLAHELLTRDGTPEREVGMWLPDDDDVTAIGEPLAGLASRRMPEGAENPDLADAVALVLGVVAYVVKQRARAAQTRFWQPAEQPEDPEPHDAPGVEL